MGIAEDRADIEANWQRQLDAMDRADTALLSSQFSPGAVLVHMTGHQQPLSEWMAGIRAGQFVYHRIEQRDHHLQVDGDAAVLVGHITTGITDDGSGQAWPLRCEQHFARTSDGWRCTRSRVTFDG